MGPRQALIAQFKNKYNLQKSENITKYKILNWQWQGKLESVVNCGKPESCKNFALESLKLESVRLVGNIEKLQFRFLLNMSTLSSL